MQILVPSHCCWEEEQEGRRRREGKGEGGGGKVTPPHVPGSSIRPLLVPEKENRHNLQRTGRNSGESPESRPKKEVPLGPSILTEAVTKGRSDTS